LTKKEWIKKTTVGLNRLVFVVLPMELGLSDEESSSSDGNEILSDEAGVSIESGDEHASHLPFVPRAWPCQLLLEVLGAGCCWLGVKGDDPPLVRPTSEPRNAALPQGSPCDYTT
jgi:hypothetical protein